LNELAFISSGLESVWHLSSRGGKPRKLLNLSPLLGKEENAEFFATIDNWNQGDLLVCHSFGGSLQEDIDKKTQEVIEKNRFISPASFSESLLHALEPIESEKQAKLVLSLLRIQ